MGIHTHKTWPMQPGGGLFLICVGIGLIYGGVVGGRSVNFGLEVGLITGFLSIVLVIIVARGRFGRPSLKQRLVVLSALGVELLVFGWLSRAGYFSDGMSLTAWALILTVVSIHFIPMAISHGPWIAGLAIVGLIWVGLCLLASNSVETLLVGDGIIKMVFGAIMATPLLILFRQPQSDTRAS